jgi:hypothetical protein
MPTATESKNTTPAATKSPGSAGKKESTNNNSNVEIDLGNTLPGPIELFILQYLPEIQQNQTLFRHSVKATKMCSNIIDRV